MRTQTFACRRGTTNFVRVSFEDGYLVLKTPYHQGLVDDLKNNIPYTDRTWSKTDKAWKVSPNYATVLHQIIYSNLGVDVQMPPEAIGTSLRTEQRIFEVRYIGRAKHRPDGSESAFGWCNGEWSVILPKSVLLSWFGQTDRPGEHNTLYSVLGVMSTATADELKTAWRRLARQWHPDTCSEPDAVSQFQAIQHAYEILRNGNTRARYNAGLALEATLGRGPRQFATATTQEYQPPLRCGYLLVEGVDKLSRFVVERILHWADITNWDGQVLVTSWRMGEDTFSERWVDA